MNFCRNLQFDQVWQIARVGQVLAKMIYRISANILDIGLPNRRSEHDCRLVKALHTHPPAPSRASYMTMYLQEPINVALIRLKGSMCC